MIRESNEREQRARVREQRRAAILDAAWQVADEHGWGGFSLERVAQRADLGRATVYGHFQSIEQLVLELAERALLELSTRLSSARELREALDAPVRFARERRAAFALLFPQTDDVRRAFSCERLQTIRAEARDKLGRVERLARRSSSLLPADAQSSAAFLQGISLAAAVVSALRDSTTLRHRWQTFCLGPTSR